MRLSFTLLFAAAVPLVTPQAYSQVHFSGSDVVQIEIAGKPFADFHRGAESGKPYLAPLRSASGKIVTRKFPMEKVEGETRDHLHHTGLWFSYDDVNTVQFWANDPSYTKGNLGKIVVTDLKMKEGRKAGAMQMTAEWRDSKGKAVLMEKRVTTFHSDPRTDAKLRIMDFDITLTAPERVVFGDTKEGAFAIRLADSMSEKKGGKMINAEGGAGMNAVWGKKSNWVDYSGDVEGEKLGIAIFDHPANPRHPTYWHSRDYGLFALDPFGQQSFDKNQPESKWVLEAGTSLRFVWRVVIHSGDTGADRIADLYKEFAK